MRNHHLPWLTLAAAVALAASCGSNGPGSRSGLTSCDQLRECACDPSRAFDVDACNMMVDSLLAGAEPERTCALELQQSGCGRPLRVDPPGF